MNSQTETFITNLVTFSDMAVKLINAGHDLDAKYNLAGIQLKIDDEELQAIPQFDYLTSAALIDAVASMQALLTSMGDKTSGAQVNFIKIIQ